MLPVLSVESYSVSVSSYDIRTFGDPVLKQRAKEVDNIDSSLAKLVDAMFDAMYDAPGVGLAAPQVGVQKRLFVYDVGDGPGVLINPEIRESGGGEWTYHEGCLSIPGLAWDVVRPKQVLLVGYDLEENEVSVEADELLARLFQHEVDHLEGTLLVERLDEEQRKQAMKVLRARSLGLPEPEMEPIRENSRRNRQSL